MSCSTRYRAALFDFDYTLGDSSLGAVDCMRYALAALGLPDVDAQTCASTIGLSLPETLVALAGEEHAPLASAFHELFMARADVVMVPQAIVYPFTGDLLSRLRRAGLSLAIVTNKRRDRIEGILARYNLATAVDAIIGSADVPSPKPAPDALLLAAERLGITLAEAVYVGDNLVDARAARAARVPFVAVTSGHTTAEAFAPFGPQAVLRDASALPDTLGLA